jgi:hypothetical protein
MDKNVLKEKLLNKCIEQQWEVVRQLEKEITDAQKMANDYGQPKDRYDAFRTKLMRQIEMFAKQLDKAKLILNTLDKIPLNEKLEKVKFGAIVITNKQNLFVSAGLGKIELEGNFYYAISPQVPIYLALEGKSKNEEINFNGMFFLIKDIF